MAAYLPTQGIFAFRPGDGLADSVFPFGIPGNGETIPVTVVDEALTQIGPAVMPTRSPSPTRPVADFFTVPTLASAKKKPLS